MILLDTHIWVNWILLGSGALKPAIASAIEDADRVVVSAISCFEVALLVKGRKLELPLSTTALEHGAQLASYDTTFPNYPELSGYLLTGQQA